MVHSAKHKLPCLPNTLYTFFPIFNGLIHTSVAALKLSLQLTGINLLTGIGAWDYFCGKSFSIYWCRFALVLLHLPVCYFYTLSIPCVHWKLGKKGLCLAECMEQAEGGPPSACSVKQTQYTPVPVTHIFGGLPRTYSVIHFLSTGSIF